MTTDLTNFDKQCSGAHFVSFLLDYNCNNGYFLNEILNNRS